MACSTVNRSSKELQRKELDDMTMCCICTQTFVSPRMLPCGHTFCFDCTQSYAVDKKPGEKISCPVCRRECKIPVDGVGGFPRNLYAEKIAKLAKKPDRASKEVDCDVCQENRINPDDAIPVASKHCIDCQQNMCTECAHHHRRNKITKTHEIVDLEGLPESTLVSFRSSTCDKHPKKPLVVYCLHCSVPVCQQCYRESHSGHKSQDVKLRAHAVKKQLEDIVRNISRLADDMKNILYEELPTSSLGNIAKTESEIHERCMEIKRIADLHEKRLLECLETVKKRRHKEIAVEKIDAEICLSEMDSFLTTAGKLKQQGSISDLSSSGTMLISRAQELQKKLDKIFKVLKAQAALPATELVPVDINSLLSNSTGNIIGRIKVNIVEKNQKNHDDYYTFGMANDDDDDPYKDCVYISELDDTELSDTARSVSEEEPYKFTERTPPPQPLPRQESSNTSTTPLKSQPESSILKEIQPTALALHYRLRSGKYTEIWRGTLNRTTDVSVKTFTPEAAREQQIVDSCNFFREAEILLKLSHPKIVNLIGVSRLTNPFYVITEFASNGFLDKYLKNEKKTTREAQMVLKDVINMASQVADAMHYLETRNCIHRFLAARSIIIGTNNFLKLANFEMAVFLKTRSQKARTDNDKAELLGSPIKTRAPEVIESQRWSTKSDVWSFAIVIYEILTYAAKPYPDLSESDFASRILTTTELLYPVGQSFKYPDPKLRSIMESCWKKDPNERPDFKYLRESLGDFFKEQDLMGYTRRPKVIKALKLKGPVSGVTTYKEELFIVRRDSTTIDAFSASSFKRTRQIRTTKSKKFLSLQKRTQDSNGLLDITSCKQQDFIYACSWQDILIYRIDPISRSVSGSWEVKNGDPTTLSVAQNGNLLISCANDGKILEYTYDGTLALEISFGCNGEGPLHTMHLANDRFVVCHGKREVAGAIEGITIIDKYGNPVPDAKPLSLAQPCYLAIDSNDTVLVAARGRSKLTLWNPSKDLQRVLVSLDQEQKVPTRIHLNESTGQLFMLYQNDTLMIYEVTSPESKAATQGSDHDYFSSYGPIHPRPLPTPVPSQDSSSASDSGEDDYERIPTDCS